MLFRSGQAMVGFFQARSHRVAAFRGCPIQAAPAEACAEALRDFLAAGGPGPWDPRSGRGFLRTMTVRSAFSSGEVMVILSAASKKLPRWEELADRLDQAVADLPPRENAPDWRLTGLFLEPFQARAGRFRTEIQPGKLIRLDGSRVLRETVGEAVYDVSPQAFWQVNPVMTESLYEKIFEYAQLAPGSEVLDLYCGVGAIGLYLARRVGGALRLTGIEVNEQAVVNANRNAVLNGIVDARFGAGRAEEVLPGLVERKKAAGTDDHAAGAGAGAGTEPGAGNTTVSAGANSRPEGSADLSASDAAAGDGAFDPETGFDTGLQVGHPQVVVLDPPRAGCREELLRAAAAADPARIVYVSCEPATMARDIRLLSGYGYAFVRACPVDMFPHSGRVECVALLLRE